MVCRLITTTPTWVSVPHSRRAKTGVAQNRVPFHKYTEGVHILLSPRFECRYHQFITYPGTDGRFQMIGLHPGKYDVYVYRWGDTNRRLVELEPIELQADRDIDFHAVVPPEE